MAQKLTINSDRSLDEVTQFIRDEYHLRRKHWMRIGIVYGPDRSGPQNDMIYHVYELVAEWFHNRDIELARAECKLNVGLPILRKAEQDLDEMCTRTVDRLDYQEQLRFIKTMDISSLMSVEQARAYIDGIIDFYAEAGILWPSYLIKGRNK